MTPKVSHGILNREILSVPCSLAVLSRLAPVSMRPARVPCGWGETRTYGQQEETARQGTFHDGHQGEREGASQAASHAIPDTSQSVIQRGPPRQAKDGWFSFLHTS